MHVVMTTCETILSSKTRGSFYQKKKETTNRQVYIKMTSPLSPDYLSIVPLAGMLFGSIGSYIYMYRSRNSLIYSKRSNLTEYSQWAHLTLRVVLVCGYVGTLLGFGLGGLVQLLL